MYHLIYISHAARTLFEEDLLDILNKSRQGNKRYNITGMLVYLNEKFMQVLEGEYNDVTEVFDKIKKDPRHHRISTLLTGNTEHRIFKDWSMGFKKLDDKQFKELCGFQDLEDFFSAQHLSNESPAVMIFLSLFYKKNLTDYPETLSY